MNFQMFWSSFIIEEGKLNNVDIKQMLSKPYDIRTTVSLCFGIYVNRQLIGCLLHCRIRHESWSEMQISPGEASAPEKAHFSGKKAEP